jgi:hypothetical protein
VIRSPNVWVAAGARRRFQAGQSRRGLVRPPQLDHIVLSGGSLNDATNLRRRHSHRLPAAAIAPRPIKIRRTDLIGEHASRWRLAVQKQNRQRPYRAAILALPPLKVAQAQA